VAKKKTARNPNDLPPRAPQDLAEAVLFGALSEVTPEVEADYVRAIYTRKGRMSKAENQRCMKAILIMATVGFSFVNWQNHRQVV
jgi:hypothetical protein